MTIYKPDGSQYTANGKGALETYRPDSVDIDLFNKYDIEKINLDGSTVIYYKCFIDTDYDKLYMESINSIWPQQGYEIKSIFTPPRASQEMSPFGIDSFDEAIFLFNIKQWKDTIGEMPKIKSLIFAKWNKVWWEVIQRDNETPYRLWSQYRLAVTAKKYQPSRGDKQPNRKDSKDNSINIF